MDVMVEVRYAGIAAKPGEHEDPPNVPGPAGEAGPWHRGDAQMRDEPAIIARHRPWRRDDQHEADSGEESAAEKRPNAEVRLDRRPHAGRTGRNPRGASRKRHGGRRMG